MEVAVKNGFAHIDGPARLMVCVSCITADDVKLGRLMTFFAKKCDRCKAPVSEAQIVQMPATKRAR